MKEWNVIKLDKILTQQNRQISIDPDVKYSLVTISNKGEVKLREVKSGANISAQKGFIAKKGDFIYSRLSVHTGAFGIVPDNLDGALITNEMPCFEINNNKILPDILIKMVGLPDFLWQLKQLTKGMGRVRIKEDMMLSLSLLLPNIAEQQKIVAYFQSIETEDAELKTELTHQQNLIKKLRQQILQEAIEGKLTADWRENNPDVKPASELLKGIQVEKAQLIKDKKIKPQKPLPPISEQEKPFALPDGWEWCRVNDIAGIGTGATPLTSEPSYYGGEINWMTSGDTSYDYVTHTKATITEKAITETNCQVYPRGTLVVAMYGQGKTRGQVTELKIDAATNQACVAIQLYLLSIEANQFLKTHFKKIYNEIRELAQGGAQPNLNMGKIKANVIALPPLPEQKAIVTKVEKLLALCDQLETQIITNQTHAEQLMQAVLKEAFSVPVPATTLAPQTEEKQAIVKRKMLASYIINQSLDDNNFGGTKFEKLLYLSDCFILQRNLGQRYYQKAAGPYDNKFTYLFFQQTQKAKWFKKIKQNQTYRIVADDNVDKSKKTYNYFSQEELEKISNLIKLFKNCNYEQPEIVATLYAALE